MRQRLWVALVTIAIAGCGGGKKAESPAAPAASAPLPKKASAPVVVALVVDQLAGWVMAERLAELPEDGGFKRLAREGTYARDMRYMHAATDTAPGHSSLFTGKPPRHSGIFGNEVPRAKAALSILRDEATKLVTEAGPRDKAGSSLARLRVPTVADELRDKHPRAAVVGLSLKDRGAGFACGRKPTACLWFDTGEDAFVTSTAFAPALPPWAAPKGGHAAVERARAAPWALVDPAWTQAHAATADDQSGEGDLGGMKTVFPHAIATPQAFRASPFADAVLVDLARAAIGAEYKEGEPFFLEISFSSNDIVGHAFGPDSWEAWEELRRVDRAIADLLGALDARFGTGYAVVLAADHGTITMPEASSKARRWCEGDGKVKDAYERPCGPSGRVLIGELQGALEAEAERALGAGPWIEGVADPYYFFTDKAKALDPKQAAALYGAVARALVRYDHALARVDTAEALAARCEAEPAEWDESIGALLCRAYPKGGGAGEGYMAPRPGFFFDPNVVVGKGTSHGSPYLYDRSVPLFVRAPGLVPAGAKEASPVHFSAYARVLRSLLGVTPETPAAALAASRKPAP